MIEHDFKERVKELRCLYRLADIVERPAITLDELYQGVANLLPSGWQYREIACARISSNGREFKTRNYRETEWKQSSDIKIHGVKAGVVEVNYLAARPKVDEGPFLKEEGQLLNAIAERLGKITEYKQAEEALSETNAQLKVLQQVTAAVHSTLDLEEVFKKITEGAVHLLGYTTALILTLNESKKCFGIKAISTRKHILPQMSKILGFPVKKMSIPEDSSFQDNVRSLLKGEVIISKSLPEVAYPMIGKKACSALQKLGGTKNYILVPLEGEKEVVGAVFISSPREEVSDKELREIETFAQVSSDAIKNASLLIRSKQSEEALRQSEENLKTYLESAPDGVYINDLKGTFLYGNKKAEELIGYTREELMGKSFLKLNLLPVKHLARAAKLLALNAIGKPTGPDEFELARKDGSRIWVEINTAPIKQAGRVVVIGSVRDITERKQTEQALQESEGRYRHLFNNLHDAAFLADVETGVIIETNQQGATLLGRSQDEIIGMHQSELHPPGKAEEYKQKFALHIRKGHAADHDGEVIRKDGTIVPVAISATNLTIQGRLLILGLFRDITERKKAEEREKQLQQELNIAGRLASIGEMASGIAHEINNPLTGVIGFSQMLMSRDIPDDIREDLEVIDSEARRVAKIVSGLLAFVHQHKPGREHVDINELILEVLKLRSYEMRINNIQVVTQLSPDLPQTIADGNQLQQVFLNIILNAGKEMVKAHGGGKLSIKTEKVKDSIRVSLTDDGPGISKENLNRVFDPFFTTRGVGQGTGLGLSICHGIVTQHKGRIYAKSELGKGATFVVELPIVTDTEQGEKPKVIGKETPKSEGAKVLVVDDEKAILTFLNRLLAEWGYEVEAVDNAFDALDRLRSKRYSLILLDIKLPGMSGIELYRHLEATDPALAQRVMFITGDVMEATTRDFLDETKAPRITKPIDVEQLKDNINHILTRELVRQR